MHKTQVSVRSKSISKMDGGKYELAFAMHGLDTADSIKLLLLYSNNQGEKVYNELNLITKGYFLSTEISKIDSEVPDWFKKTTEQMIATKGILFAHEDNQPDTLEESIMKVKKSSVLLSLLEENPDLTKSDLASIAIDENIAKEVPELKDLSIEERMGIMQEKLKELKKSKKEYDALNKKMSLFMPYNPETGYKKQETNIFAAYHPDKYVTKKGITEVVSAYCKLFCNIENPQIMFEKYEKSFLLNLRNKWEKEWEEKKQKGKEVKKYIQKKYNSKVLFDFVIGEDGLSYAWLENGKMIPVGKNKNNFQIDFFEHFFK